MLNQGSRLDSGFFHSIKRAHGTANQRTFLFTWLICASPFRYNRSTEGDHTNPTIVCHLLFTFHSPVLSGLCFSTIATVKPIEFSAPVENYYAVLEFMLVIGIAGGVGSGKSSVAKHLASLGAVSLDADQIGHDVLDAMEVKEQLVERWGASIMTASGEVDRAAVSEIVFGQRPESLSELSFLEKLIHPRIAGRLEKRIKELEQAGEFKILVLDAAVMFKAGWDRFCDKFVFVDATETARLARCQQRGWTAEEFRQREASQQSLGLKRGRADWVVDNSGAPEQAFDQLAEIWGQLVKLT